MFSKLSNKNYFMREDARVPSYRRLNTVRGLKKGFGMGLAALAWHWSHYRSGYFCADGHGGRGNDAGPGIMISFALRTACTFVALCYAELASLIPVSGSTYTYTYVALGEIFAWFIGWNLVLEYAAGAATVAVGWAGYFNRVVKGFGFSLPPQLTSGYFSYLSSHGTSTGGVFNLPAAGIILVRYRDPQREARQSRHGLIILLSPLKRQSC